LADPFGHHWTLATHKEDLSVEEVQKLFEASMKRGAGASTSH
jgi:hypothetical protein